MSNVTITNHPLIQHKLSILRRVETSSKDFRTLVSEIAMLLCYEATRDLHLKDVEIETPICKTTARNIDGKKLAVVPILRAGLGMVEGVLELIPSARVGHIGLYRDPETLMPVEYYCKLPADINERDVFVVDPMLATGGSAIDAISQIKLRKPRSIKFMCIISAPEGIAALQKAHPDVEIFCAAMDEKLNEHGYIVPGLGDAGDSAQVGDVFRESQGPVAGDTGGGFLTVVESGHAVTELLEGGIVRGGPPVGGVAVLVVFGPVVVKSVGDLVGDDIADLTQVLLIGGRHIVEGNLQNGRREGDGVVGGAVTGVD